MLFTNKRFGDVSERARQYMSQDSAQRSRGDYASGIAELESWLSNAESLLKDSLPFEHKVVREHLLKLEVCAKNSRERNLRFNEKCRCFDV